MNEIWKTVDKILRLDCNVKVTYQKENQQYVVTIFNNTTKWQLGIAITDEMLSQVHDGIREIFIQDALMSAYHKTAQAKPAQPSKQPGLRKT